MGNTLGDITDSGNVFFWNVSITDILSYRTRSHVHSPSFSYRGCLWNIGVFVTGKESTFAYLQRELLDFGNEYIRVLFALGFKWEHGHLQQDPVPLNSVFWSFNRCGELYFLRNENLYNTAKSSNITLSCRFVEGDVSQRMLLPMIPAVVPHSNQEVATWTLQLSEAHATIRKLTEEKESNLQEIENLKNPNKDPELEALSANFRELLSSEHRSDVVLKVQDKEFRAHMAVLGVRSPVFHATFRHNFEEEKTGVVTIPDCDPETFPLFLSFLYSGKVGELTVDTAEQLYSISDKYDVQALKSICCNHLIQCLTPENVCDIAVLADLHSDDHLASEVQHYFNENYLQVLATSEWTATSENNLRISNKLLKEMALASKKPRSSKRNTSP